MDQIQTGSSSGGLLHLFCDRKIAAKLQLKCSKLLVSIPLCLLMPYMFFITRSFKTGDIHSIRNSIADNI